MFEEILKAINESEDITGNLYDYIANNYYCLSHDILKDILLEVIYTLNDPNPSKEKLIENLKYRFDE